MEARAKVLGHPIHQMLIPVPFGLFTTAAVLDIIAAVSGAHGLTVVSFWNLAIGIVVALIAAVFGLIDWSAIPRGTRARRIGAIHGIGNVLMVLLFGFAVLVRGGEPHLGVPAVALVAEVAALMLGVITGWLGGELVDRLGVGVHPDANLDGPRRSHVEVEEVVVPGPREVVVRDSGVAPREHATPPYGTPRTTT